MKTKNNVIQKFGKVLLVFCTLFSQLSFSLEVFADEVVDSLSGGEVDTVSEETAMEDSDNLENEVIDANNSGSEELDTNLEDSDSSDTTIGGDTVGEVENNDEEPTDDTTDGELVEEPGDDTTEEDPTDDPIEDEPIEEDPIVEDVFYIIEDGFILINGTFNSNLTVSMLKNAIMSDVNYSESIIVVSDADEELSDEDIITNNMTLSIDGVNYLIVVIGDFDNDGIVGESDIDALIEDILLTLDGEEEVFDVADVTYVASAIRESNWITDEVILEDILSFETSVSSSNVLVGDTFEVSLIVNDFDKNYINGIEGIVSYDESLVELESISVLEDVYVKGSKNEEGKFVYLLNDYNSDGEALLTFTFRALSVGEDVEIKIEDIIMAMDGYYVEVLDDTNYISTYVSVAPAGMGGDDPGTDVTDPEEPVDNDEQLSDDVTNVPDEEPVEVVNTVNTVDTVTVVEDVALSDDNYISSLEIDGYDIDFDMYTYEYNISVGSDVDSLDLSIVLNDSSASYVVNGNSDFSEGSNTVEIVVTASDGTERTYTINVDKEASQDVSDDTEEEESSNISRTVIIILIVLVIIGLIYVIFKDDDDTDVKSDISKKSVDSKKNKK